MKRTKSALAPAHTPAQPQYDPVRIAASLAALAYLAAFWGALAWLA